MIPKKPLFRRSAETRATMRQPGSFALFILMRLAAVLTVGAFATLVGFHTSVDDGDLLGSQVCFNHHRILK